MIYVLLYAAAGVSTAALGVWLGAIEEGFDFSMMLLAAFVFWPIALLGLGLQHMGKAIANVREQHIEQAREAARELRNAEREVEFLLTGKRGYDY